MSAPDAGGSDGSLSDEDSGRSFEDLLAELEAVTERLGNGQIGIEAAADLYERAEALHALARARLDAVQDRVDRLAGERAADRPPHQERPPPSNG